MVLSAGKPKAALHQNSKKLLLNLNKAQLLNQRLDTQKLHLGIVKIVHPYATPLTAQIDIISSLLKAESRYRVQPLCISGLATFAKSSRPVEAPVMAGSLYFILLCIRPSMYDGTWSVESKSDTAINPDGLAVTGVGRPVENDLGIRFCCSNELPDFIAAVLCLSLSARSIDKNPLDRGSLSSKGNLIMVVEYSPFSSGFKCNTPVDSGSIS